MNFYYDLNIPSDKAIRRIAVLAVEHGFNAYVVGGFVRDRLLNKICNDVDISVAGDAIEFGNIVAASFGKQLDAVYNKFGTALLNVNLDNTEIKIEFVSARKESYRKNSRKPIVVSSTIEDDLSRRDFTINALAVSLNENSETIIDKFGGLDDFKKKILRTPLDPSKTFDDDPLRMLRAIRFASQLDFKIHPDSFSAIIKMKRRLAFDDTASGVVSQERITDEIFKILMSNKPSVGFILLQKSGLMEIIFPEVAKLEGVDQRKDFHHKDVFYHTLQVLDNISVNTNNVWLRFTALMHDIAKPPTKLFIEGIGWTFHGHEELGAKWQKKIFNKLRLPLDKLTYVSKLVRLHLRPIALANEGVTDSAIRRLIYEAGDDLEDLMKLCRADITSKDPQKVKRYLANFDRVEKRVMEVEERDKIRNFQSPVNGEEIMKICSLEPSKKVGILKSKIVDAILDGVIPNEYEAALDFLYKIKDEVLENQPRG